MLDFSFGELAIIGAVALVVLGPERLPKVARTAGQWVSRAQRYVNDVKADIQREAELAELKKLQQDVQQSARELESSMHQNLTSIESELNQTAVDATRTDAVAPETGSYEPEAWRTPADDATAVADFIKPVPTVEELAERIEHLQQRLAGDVPRFKYAPRARAHRAGGARRRLHH